MSRNRSKNNNNRDRAVNEDCEVTAANYWGGGGGGGGGGGRGSCDIFESFNEY